MKMKQLKVKEAIIALIQAGGEKGTQPSQELQKQFGLSRQQVSRYFTDLVKQGIITSHGTGRGVYILSRFNNNIGPFFFARADRMFTWR